MRCITPERRPGGPAPHGFTLFEAVLVLALTGLVLGIVTAVGIRLQRQLRDTQSRIETGEQLSTVAAILPLDLRGLSPAAGDIRAGEARDSSLELRSTLTSAVVCGGTAASPLLAPFLPSGAGSAIATTLPGDTVWLLADSDSGERWLPTTIRAVRTGSASCTLFAGDAGGMVVDVRHTTTLDLRDTIPFVSGSVVRITRPVRYSLYRASDGFWYLGVRTWNSASARFNGVQPLSGPYASPGSGPDDSRIEYFDGRESVVPSGNVDTRSIARIEWLVRTGGGADAPVPRDSARIVVAMRNRQ